MKWKMILLMMLFLGFSWIEKGKRQDFLIFCNVGQGDGALLVVDGIKILIDTGPQNKQMLKCMEKYLPFWEKQIDAVMISHWDSDHSGGLSDVLKYYEVKNVFCADYESGVVEQKKCTKKLKNNDKIKIGMINFEILSSGQKIENNKNKKVDDNESSLVEVLHYRDKRILFTGDITKETEERLIWRKILMDKVDVLKVSHHGSGFATSETLLKEIRPKLAVVSVGKNSFGHPVPATLLRLTDYGVRVYRTDIDGDLKINLYY